jgi:hypothetical protein
MVRFPKNWIIGVRSAAAAAWRRALVANILGGKLFKIRVQEDEQDCQGSSGVALNCVNPHSALGKIFVKIGWEMNVLIHLGAREG